MIKLIASQVTIDAAAGEAGRREITGIAVPTAFLPPFPTARQ